jgi:hypothetical protein
MTNAFIYLPTKEVLFLEDVTVSNDSSRWVTIRGIRCDSKTTPIDSHIVEYQKPSSLKEHISDLLFGKDPARFIYSFPPDAVVHNCLVTTTTKTKVKYRIPFNWILLVEPAQ